MRTTKVTSLSLPPKLLREAERLARREGRTKSELLREALRRYVADSRWRELQEFGRSQARKLGIEESDVERLVAEYRATTNSTELRHFRVRQFRRALAAEYPGCGPELPA